MNSPENHQNSQEALKDISLESAAKFGVGHMPEGTVLSMDKIDTDERAEVLSTYEKSCQDIESLMLTIEGVINEVNTQNRSSEVFGDMQSGIKDALYKTANQILYHASTDTKESLAALDELSMVLDSVNDSLRAPQILQKKDYPSSASYQLKPLENTEGYEIKSFDALFSKEHIAFNLISSPSYKNTDKTIKSGIRMDYGPLYKETPQGEINKNETEWVTSVDISGYYIDRIMNQYSPRGHHFTKMFTYKINLLMQGFAKQMESRFDASQAAT
jgi:hypothetical protein